MNPRLDAWHLLCRLLLSNDEPPVDNLSERLGHEAFSIQLISLANQSFVTGSLWIQLRRRGSIHALPEELRDYLKAFYDLNAQRNTCIHAQLLECTDALNKAGITPMPLKGAAYLLTGLYEDLGERLISDIDVLVPECRATDAAAALLDIGFRSVESKFDYSAHHHLPTFVRTVDDVAVEIHTAPVLSVAQSALPTVEIWSDADALQQEGRDWRLASATDTVMLSFLHGEVVDRDLARLLVNLRTFMDLKQIVRRYRSNIDWKRNMSRAESSGFNGSLHRYLHTFTQLTGNRLWNSYRARRRDRIYFALCKAGVRWPKLQHWAEVAEKLSSRNLKKHYSLGDSSVIVNAYRLRALARMLRNGDLP